MIAPYTPPILALDIFERLATDIWTRLEDGEALEVPQGEVTITEHILLHIARARLPIIAIDKTTLPEEAEMGADWEWWIGTGCNWWRFAIQAKKLYPKHNSYEELGHVIKRDPPKMSEYQFDVLERYARRKGAIPLYALYNHYSPAGVNHWHCRTTAFSTGEQQQFGCTLAPLETIREVIAPRKHKTFEKVHIHRSGLTAPVPWRCLFHPVCMGGTVGAPGEAHPLAGKEFGHIRTRPLPPDLQARLMKTVPISRISAEELFEGDDYPSDIEWWVSHKGRKEVRAYRPRLYPAFIIVIDINREG